MKLDTGFITHITKGEHYMISTGNTAFKGILKNNETAAFIIECLKEDTSESIIVDKLMAEYEGAERSEIRNDVSEIIARLRSIGAVND